VRWKKDVKDFRGGTAKVKDWMEHVFGSVSKQQVEFSADRTSGSRNRATTPNTCAPVHPQLKRWLEIRRARAGSRSTD
jgi:hypothetical protein